MKILFWEIKIKYVGPGSIDKELLRLVKENNGGRIHAVKHYREATGAGLKESLDHVNKILDKHKIPYNK